MVLMQQVVAIHKRRGGTGQSMRMMCRNHRMGSARRQLVVGVHLMLVMAR